MYITILNQNTLSTALQFSFMNLILESNQVLYFLYICNGVLVALLSMCAYFSVRRSNVQCLVTMWYVQLFLACKSSFPGWS